MGRLSYDGGVIPRDVLQVAPLVVGYPRRWREAGGGGSRFLCGGFSGGLVHGVSAASRGVFSPVAGSRRWWFQVFAVVSVVLFTEWCSRARVEFLLWFCVYCL